MTKSGFCGIKLPLRFNFLLFNASQKKMREKRDQGRLHVAKGGEKCASWRVDLSLSSTMDFCFKSWLFTALICTLLPDFTVLSHSWGACGCRLVGKPGGRAALSPLSQNYQVRSPAHPAHAGRDAPQCQPPENPPGRWWLF